ncbi:hypothetical protein SOVF_073650 isoform A [Spinacia oleracea]|nr:hypothetical protein SOVF_073650 isoform A [Spinacia oleracea]
MPSVNLSLACDHQFVNVILVFSLCNLGFDIHRTSVTMILPECTFRICSVLWHKRSTTESHIFFTEESLLQLEELTYWSILKDGCEADLPDAF